MAGEPLPDLNSMSDEDLAVHAARARASAAKAKADAEAKAAQEGGGFWSGVGSTIADAGKNALGYAGQFAHGAGRGLAMAADMPAEIGTGIGNVYNRLAGEPLATAPTGVTDWYDRNVPSVKGFEDSYAEDIGNFFGPIIATGGAGEIANAVRAAPGLARALWAGLSNTGRIAGRAAVTAGSAHVGGEAGKAIGQAIDERTGGTAGQDYLEPLLSTLAGGMGPEAIANRGYRVGNRIFTDRAPPPPPGGGPAIVDMETSAERLAAADRLNAARPAGAEGGIPISLDFLGNQASRDLGDFTASPIGGGAPAVRTRRAQNRGLDEAIGINADMMRGIPDPVFPRPGPGRAIAPSTIGADATPVFSLAHAHAQRMIDDVYDGPGGLHSTPYVHPQTGAPTLFSRETATDPRPVLAVIDQMLADPRTHQSAQGPMLQGIRDRIVGASNQIIDPAVDAALRQQRAAELGNARAQNRPPDHSLIARIDAQIQDNLGPSFDAMRRDRAITHDLTTGFAIDNPIIARLRVAQDDAMRQAAERAGVPRGQFDAAEQRASDLMRERDQLKLAPDRTGEEAATRGQIHSRLFGAEGVGDTAQTAALLEHNPAGAHGLAADQYEMQMRGPVAAGSPVATAENLNAGSAADWYAKQRDPITQRLYHGDDPVLRQRLEDTALLARTEALRPTRTKPGRGRNTLGGPAMAWALPSILGGAGILGGGPAGILAAAVPTIAARFVGNRFTDPTFTRRTIHPPTFRQSVNLPRVLSSAVAAAAAAAAPPRN